jgi:hypothetical protein
MFLKVFFKTFQDSCFWVLTLSFCQFFFVFASSRRTENPFSLFSLKRTWVYHIIKECVWIVKKRDRERTKKQKMIEPNLHYSQTCLYVDLYSYAYLNLNSNSISLWRLSYCCWEVQSKLWNRKWLPQKFFVFFAFSNVSNLRLSVFEILIAKLTFNFRCVWAFLFWSKMSFFPY